MTWAEMSVFKELTGMVAVGLATLWTIYVLVKKPNESTITISQDFNVFLKGDKIIIGGDEYVVVKAKGQQLTVNGPTWKGRIQSVFNRIRNLF